MYATVADMVQAFSEREVIALTDRDQLGEVDDVVLVGALEKAGHEIDTYIGGRYQLPLATVPAVLTTYACDIARYRLCGSGVLVTEDIRDRYRDALRFLERVADGRQTLSGMPDGGVAATSNTVRIKTSGRVFARENGAY